MSTSDIATLKAAVDRVQAEQERAIDGYNREVRKYSYEIYSFTEQLRRLRQELQELS